ncbi:MAG TPA: folylpolyglutamate synthase/dihydrofolate synthase family protein [Candidatus Acidoferrales bacterium]|nr:folylpolyglutamate synthase/dihydrofolate synthase family protein [Candidatus Acidoferrales bacterium]
MSFTYSEAVQRLLWLGHEGSSLKWDLNNVRAVLERRGNPERSFRSVHIAGTNGKGSVAAMTESILRAAGHRTGLYTSPHLERINERIVVGSEPISDADFAATFSAVAATIEALLAENAIPNHPSFFETMTAMAFWHFAQAGVEVAVLEVGMGGRLDATNVVTPAVAAITSIDFDHERYLGHSIAQIVAEKAGIIKAGVPVINAAENPQARTVVAARAAEVGAPMVDLDSAYRAEDVRHKDFGLYEFTARASDDFVLPLAPSLRGRFQVRNARVATAVARQLSARGWTISNESIAAGLARTQWPGRFELARREPLVFLDGAHNPAGARQVARFWEEHLRERQIHLVYGTVREKAVGEMAELLFPRAASVTLTQAETPRAASAESLRPLAQVLNDQVAVEPDPAQALASAMARAGAEGVVFVTGSLFLVGDCRRALREMSTAVVVGGRSK